MNQTDGFIHTMKRFLFILAFLYFSALHGATPTAPNLTFIENKGQWPGAVLYKTDIPGGRLFLEKNTFTYVYYNIKDLQKAHPEHEHGAKDHEPNPDELIRCHSLKVHAIGASSNVTVLGDRIRPEYYNYFIGNNPAGWASHVLAYNGVRYEGIYPSTDMHIYSMNGNLKYDFIVREQADVSRIRLYYSGAKKLALKEGSLFITTSVNEIVEQKPYAYQEIGGIKHEVGCKFVLDHDSVSFAITTPYDASQPLIIDPVVLAATYSGSLAIVYGHAATFDSLGNIYAGGRCFGSGYPATTGSFSQSFGGATDISISKLNPTGSALIYATYLGGNGPESPYSMFVNASDELCVYGSTTSPNYPTTSGAVSNVLTGTSDIVVTHLSSNGSGLIGSTYIGGTGVNGNNNIHIGSHDAFRGEIIADANDNMFIASFSDAPDFPITPGAQANSGGQDAVIFELNPDCTSLLWSTCYGGSNDDAAFGIRLDGSGGVILSGGTKSTDFPVTAGCYQPSFQGGIDGWIARIEYTTNSLLTATYYGSSGNEQAFFVDVDADLGIYILGQTTGTFAISPGTYGNTGGKTVLAKLDPTLTYLEFQTVIGAPTKTIDPTAFMVDNCGSIYLSGYGNASTYPLTSNAFYTSQTIGSFYLAVLSPNAAALSFATFYGGSHVDGGTSRFDKRGVVYQGVCEGGTGFPTLPTAYATTTTVSWDICVFKIDFQIAGVTASATANPDTSGCQPFNVTFTNTSSSPICIWDFGDGSSPDTTRNPVHLFSNPGNFRVMLVAINNFCNLTDTFYLNIHVAPALPHQSILDTVLCNAPSLTLTAPLTGPQYSYDWMNGITTATLTVNNPAIYRVKISNGGCQTTDSFNVARLIPPNLGPDSSLCEDQDILLNPQTNASSLLWSTGDTTRTLFVDQADIFWVDATLQTCTLRDSTTIHMLEYPVVNLGSDTILCPHSLPNVTLTAGNTVGSLLWSTGDTLRQITTASEGEYWLQAGNAQCLVRDSIRVSVALPLITPQADVSFCDYTHAYLDAQVEHVNYLWSTGETTQKIHVVTTGEFWYSITYNTCMESDTLKVDGAFGEELIWVPNAFSPNGDGRNDLFNPMGTDLVAYSLNIYNRWGKLVFSSETLGNGWDGKVDGKLVPSGIYSYVIKYATSCSEEPVSKWGHVMMLE